MSNSDNSHPLRRRAPIPREVCPLALAAEILGDRWTLLILREAFYGVVRYDDMLADLSAPRSMLTDRLSKLVDRGLIARKPYQEPGSRTRQAYVLTDAGRALGQTLIALSQWGEAHVSKQPAPIEFVERETSRPVRAALINDEGQNVALGKVEMRLRE